MRFLIILALFSTALIAEKSEIFAPDGIALKGYDIIMYLKKEKAVKGDPKYSTEYKGVKWYFSSKKALDYFKRSPEKYMPEYGGYCAYGLGKGGYLAKTEPDAFTVIDGKLYLNYNKGIQKKWDANKKNFIKTADDKWKKDKKKLLK